MLNADYGDLVTCWRFCKHVCCIGMIVNSKGRILLPSCKYAYDHVVLADGGLAFVRDEVLPADRHLRRLDARRDAGSSLLTSTRRAAIS